MPKFKIIYVVSASTEVENHNWIETKEVETNSFEEAIEKLFYKHLENDETAQSFRDITLENLSAIEVMQTVLN